MCFLLFLTKSAALLSLSILFYYQRNFLIHVQANIFLSCSRNEMLKCFNKSGFPVNLGLFKPKLLSVFDYSGVFLDMRHPKIVFQHIRLHILKFS